MRPGVVLLCGDDVAWTADLAAEILEDEGYDVVVCRASSTTGHAIPPSHHLMALVTLGLLAAFGKRPDVRRLLATRNENIAMIDMISVPGLTYEREADHLRVIGERPTWRLNRSSAGPHDIAGVVRAALASAD